MRSSSLRQSLTIVFAAGMACAGCQDATVDTANLPKIGVEFELTERYICEGSGSPAIRLSDIPAGVVSYDVRMTDLDSPGYRHWRETVLSHEPAIPAGTGSHYSGPACPPNGHRYRISILARNARRQPIAYGEKTITAERARSAR
jgi:phosphatidylethanolamine-binding protein (PEBP) family uncharacterized protein